MAVKELVGLFESRSKIVSATSSSTSAVTSSRAQHAPEVLRSSRPSLSPANVPQDLPTSSPARFISHPLLRRREPSSADQEDEPLIPESSATSSSRNSGPHELGGNGDIVDADVADALQGGPGSKHNSYAESSSLAYSSSLGHSTKVNTDDGFAIELRPLLPNSIGTPQTTVHPDDRERRNFGLSGTGPNHTSLPKPHQFSSSTATLVSSSNPGPHTPVPLSQILARSAAPVSLPKLDEYISNLELPSFPPIHHSDSGQGKGKEKPSEIAMFPPMERLAGTTLVDLENNAKIPPTWRNKTSIFSMLLNVALGITVGLVHPACFAIAIYAFKTGFQCHSALL